MSRFNTLLLGEPERAAEELENCANEDELRAALINALRRIAVLEQRFGNVSFAARLNAETIHNMAQASAEVDRDAGC